MGKLEGAVIEDAVGYERRVYFYASGAGDDPAEVFAFIAGEVEFHGCAGDVPRDILAADQVVAG